MIWFPCKHLTNVRNLCYNPILINPNPHPIAAKIRDDRWSILYNVGCYQWILFLNCGLRGRSVHPQQFRPLAFALKQAINTHISLNSPSSMHFICRWLSITWLSIIYICMVFFIETKQLRTLTNAFRCHLLFSFALWSWYGHGKGGMGIYRIVEPGVGWLATGVLRVD